MRSLLYALSVLSLPMRGAWIGITTSTPNSFKSVVAPHAGSVDWNIKIRFNPITPSVAPHAGSVDWNIICSLVKDQFNVAPHAGSVDWNSISFNDVAVVTWSLPMRGAWIGIVQTCSLRLPHWKVAPHAGSVDWNSNKQRRWKCEIVAPHAGSVDWNL